MQIGSNFFHIFVCMDVVTGGRHFPINSNKRTLQIYFYQIIGLLTKPEASNHLRSTQLLEEIDFRLLAPGKKNASLRCAQTHFGVT
jgi:hypothetical protein